MWQPKMGLANQSDAGRHRLVRRHGSVPCDPAFVLDSPDRHAGTLPGLRFLQGGIVSRRLKAFPFFLC